MVVKSSQVQPPGLDLGYLALFLGMRVNQLVIERLSAAGFRNVRESHGYVIQHLIGRERSISELARRMEVSQQAASKSVAELAELGIIELIPASDRRSKNARLSASGWKLIQQTRRIRRRIEARLIRVAGAADHERARAVLATCLGAVGGVARVRTRRIQPPQ